MVKILGTTFFQSSEAKSVDILKTAIDKALYLENGSTNFNLALYSSQRKTEAIH